MREQSLPSAQERESADPARDTHVYALSPCIYRYTYTRCTNVARAPRGTDICMRRIENDARRVKFRRKDLCVAVN